MLTYPLFTIKSGQMTFYQIDSIFCCNDQRPTPYSLEINKIYKFNKIKFAYLLKNPNASDYENT